MGNDDLGMANAQSMMTKNEQKSTEIRLPITPPMIVVDELDGAFPKSVLWW